MKRLKQTAAIIFILALGSGFTTPTGQGPFRVSDQQVEQLLVRLDAHTESFRQRLEEAVDRGFLRNAEMGSYIKQFA